ncbi:MAG: n-acetylglutamate synthase [Crocinitomicaceae bacterium]
MNYDNKKFRALSNSENGEIEEGLIFHYRQKGNVLSCAYAGDKISSGHLLGIVHEDGSIEMRYHQVNSKGELMTGTCKSVPEVQEDGKIRLYETWKWTSGDLTSGQSILEEID